MTNTVDIDLRTPTVADGPILWRMASESATLDVNPPYAYLLWCRDFAATSVVAHIDRRPAGFLTGFRRPEQPDTMMVWQVAVDSAHRGAGVAGRMLDHLAQRLQPEDVTNFEASVTPDNVASQRLFSAFARRWNAPLERCELFGSELFPIDHASEQLFRIGPLGVPHSG